MLTCPILLCHPHKNVFYWESGSILDPLSHTGQAVLISLSFILSILESLLGHSILPRLPVISYRLIKEGLQIKLWKLY